VEPEDHLFLAVAAIKERVRLALREMLRVLVVAGRVELPEERFPVAPGQTELSSSDGRIKKGEIHCS
jgi:hypothetical protein